MRVAYVRVSTVEQNEERQRVALKPYNIEKWFVEKVSAKDMNRPRLKEMLEFVREGDEVYVEDFSRLARSTHDLLEMVQMMDKKNVRIVSLKENLDTNTNVGKLMLTMMSAIYEFERANILERQREGIAIAKAQGKYKGRKLIEVDEADFQVLWNAYMTRKITKAQMAKKLHVSRVTLDRILKEKGLMPQRVRTATVVDA